MVKSNTASTSKPETSKILMCCDEKMDTAKTTEADLLNSTGCKTTDGQLPTAMEWLLGKLQSKCYKTYVF